MKNNIRNAAEKKAAYYFVTELKPVYDRIFLLHEEEMIAPDFKNLSEEMIVKETEIFLKVMEEKRNKLSEENKILEIKKIEFEKLKVAFDGFNLKEMDNLIKENENKMLKKKKIKNF
jgi:hypothetical protein